MDIKGAKNPYDALIDDFEPNMTADNITSIFDEMKTGLKKVLDMVMAEEKPDVSFLDRSVPIPIQEKIGERIATRKYAAAMAQE